MTNIRLLDAVDALTRPTVDNVKQTTDDGTYIRTVPVEHPALLQQLADAVVPSAGNDGGSKSASARERNIIDSDALWELTKIETQLRDWMRHDLAAFDRKDLPASLRRWYVAYAATTQPNDDITEWLIRELRRWERTILSRLDRTVKQLETGHLCPLCKTAEWIDPDGARQPARLILSYRRDDDGRTSEERVICQRCRTGWDSMAAIEELGEELTESEKISV
jgi:hypothetical protein